jgi:hypothetical protein
MDCREEFLLFLDRGERGKKKSRNFVPNNSAEFFRRLAKKKPLNGSE